MSRPTAWRSVAVALVLMLFVVGCASPRGGIAAPTPQAATPEASFEGVLWKLQSYVDQSGQTVTVLPDTIVTAKFVSGVLAGGSGCNQYNVSYELDGDKLAIKDRVRVTSVNCPEPPGLMDQESAYLAALPRANSYEATGAQLVITDSGLQPILTYTAPAGQ